MTLPPKVIALLGEDATPEKAIVALEQGQENDARSVGTMGCDDPHWALMAWVCALAAAAIRECEARRQYGRLADAESALLLDGARSEFDAANLARMLADDEMRSATNAYDAIRNWRKQ